MEQDKKYTRKSITEYDVGLASLVYDQCKMKFMVVCRLQLSYFFFFSLYCLLALLVFWHTMQVVIYCIPSDLLLLLDMFYCSLTRSRTSDWFSLAPSIYARLLY